MDQNRRQRWHRVIGQTSIRFSHHDMITITILNDKLYAYQR